MVKGGLQAAVDLPRLPNGWSYKSVCALGASGEQAVLTGPFGTNLSRNDFVERGVPVLTIGCLTESGISLDKALFVTEAKARELKRYRLREGDLLFSRMASVGRAGLVPSSLEGALFNYHIMRLRLDEAQINPRIFIIYVRGAGQVRDYLKAVNHGATRDGINTEQLLELPVAVPPVPAQREIVAEIEKQFSRLDEAVANLKRVKANLKRYKAAVLKAAVEGRLVPTEAELARREGRAYETGEQLVRRIIEERLRSRKITHPGNQKTPVDAEFSHVTCVPDGWSIASLDQLTSKITSGSRDWSRYYNRGTSIFLLAQNVRPLIPDFSMRQLVDPPKGDPSRERSRVATGDLLATIVGANTGQVCLVTSAPKDAYVCQSVALIRPVAPAIAAYLNYWLNSEEHGQRYFDRCNYGQGRPHLSFEQLMATPIAVPPLAEQHRIVAEVDRRLSLVREVEAEVDANFKRAGALRQATLSRAFSPIAAGLVEER